MLMEVVLVISIVSMLGIFLSYKNDKMESEISPYECGFTLMMSSRIGFSYRFFLISILFLLFDVEICLILPLPFLVNMNVEVPMVIFMMILLLGLLYEYYNGVISWI
uniref:NADH-ubiquinone oxidoreductase chain 3 n=1 Tax=Atypus karschi TaxID=2337319 RepID=A0A8A5Y880_9ARAC|nr:NADH dehydrogenase subunit 3 [Atypus karschi]QTH31100.1 NADH dehydrogenase subunit 3 [Atypus karschi]